MERSDKLLPKIMASPSDAPVTSTSPPNTRAGRIYFPHLDGLRFWAFFVVLLLHNTNTLPGKVSESPAFTTISGVAEMGTLGVNFFFVLSGFLITFLLLVEREQTGRIDIVAFYLRRALRIWPLYFLCIAMALALHFDIPRGAEPPLAPLLTFTSNFAAMHNLALTGPEQKAFGPVGVLWSVGIEEQFYLVWPVMMSLILAKVSKNRVAWCFAGVCALSLASRILWRDNGLALYYHTLCVIGDMALGGFAAWNCFSSPRWPAWFEGLSRSSIIGGYLLLAGAIAHQGLARDVPWVQVFIRPILAALFAFVILEQCYARNSFYKCGNSRWLSQLGTYTCGLYCLHLFAVVLVSRRLLKWGLDQNL